MYLSNRNEEALMTKKMLISINGGLGVLQMVKNLNMVMEFLMIQQPTFQGVVKFFLASMLFTKEKQYFTLCEEIVEGFMNAFNLKIIDKTKSALDYSNKKDVLNANALAMSYFAFMYKETKKVEYKNIVQKLFRTLLEL
jgi:hypothetical protein